MEQKQRGHSGDPGTAGVGTRELHVRRDARKRYKIDSALYSLSGDVVVADLDAARSLAREMNRSRDLSAHPETAVRVGDLNAVGLIDEIMHFVVGRYCADHGAEVFARAFDSVADAVGLANLEQCLTSFAESFPSAAQFASGQSPAEYLNGSVGERPAREVAFEEMLMLWLENRNPAFKPFSELFNDEELSHNTAYDSVLGALEQFFAAQPLFGPDNEPLTTMLGKPAQLFPDSLEDQLGYIKERWGLILGDHLFRLLRGIDYLREDRKTGFAGPGPSRTYSYTAIDPEHFSPDRDWMPNVVLIAKSSLVWLDQLSRLYDREVLRLDQIPDEELDRLASFGINALWLIGLWERSHASRRIKHIGGNPEAEASAYALDDYEIADRLGGWPAVSDLRSRCADRGIRLASDMVPNHTGIDGQWVFEHPEWYIQTEHPPFSGYTFTGEDLSANPGVGLFLEDHYYDRTDAAVVFRRTDNHSGEHRYIYHGNDGTSMPWNDTAQLNFLDPDLREAVIQTILHVAHNFPIIRFDAAMTLAKKHIHRLWYPEPGSGGDIPSRSEHGLTREQIDAAMPVEFWREVVDRVAAEAPDTLLLAEAFWMMEGYFVRTLGMHRVYNSAFMNMFKDEENAKYRETIKNTIAFDKDILKRFVNFMNNPDEDTAVEQFGTGDKYFGVCTLMLTMPGLPMIGHGQIEGFKEKYGMEFSRAYWDESPDPALLERHEREIFPLMRRRYLFSSVDNFLLYDVSTEGGPVNENVFVYSNQVGAERSLVLYNNVFQSASGWIKSSAGYVEKTDGEVKEHSQTEIARAFDLHAEHGYYCLLFETRSGLWFVRPSLEIHERGLYLNLDGYQCQVFLDIHEEKDTNDGIYAQLADELGGGGVANLDEALREIAVKPVLDLLSIVANSRNYHLLSPGLAGEESLDPEFVTGLSLDYGRFVTLAMEYKAPTSDSTGGESVTSEETLRAAVDDFTSLLTATVSLPSVDPVVDPVTNQVADRENDSQGAAEIRAAMLYYRSAIRDRADVRDLLSTWVLLAPLGKVYKSAPGVCDEWGLAKRASRGFLAETSDDSWRRLIRVLLLYRGWWQSYPTAGDLLAELIHDSEVTTYLGFNEYNGTVWFNQQRFEDLTWWLYATALIDKQAETPDTSHPGPAGDTPLLDLHRIALDLEAAMAASGFSVAKLLEAAGVQSTEETNQPADSIGEDE